MNRLSRRTFAKQVTLRAAALDTWMRETNDPGDPEAITWYSD